MAVSWNKETASKITGTGMGETQAGSMNWSTVEQLDCPVNTFSSE